MMDAFDELIDTCQAYAVDEFMLLTALHNGADPESVYLAALARLDQLTAAVKHARADRPRSDRRADPGE
jgi:hypothetical protein